MFSYFIEGHGGAGVQGCDYNAADVNSIPTKVLRHFHSVFSPKFSRRCRFSGGTQLCTLLNRVYLMLYFFKYFLYFKNFHFFRSITN